MQANKKFQLIIIPWYKNRARNNSVGISSLICIIIILCLCWKLPKTFIDYINDHL